MARCELCGKGPQFGRNVSFSKRRTNRMWHPNLQTVTMTVDGHPKKVTVCARCMRTLNKQGRI